MRPILLSIFCVSLLLTTSCNVNVANETEVARIDSTMSVLNTTIEALDTIDITSFDEMTKKLEILDKEVWTFYEKGDTAKIWRNEISSLQKCIKSLSRYAGESTSIRKSLLENKKQLESLKHDLEHDLVEKNKIEEYVATELAMTTKSLSRSAKRGGRALNCIQNYDQIVMRTDSRLTHLKLND